MKWHLIRYEDGATRIHVQSRTRMLLPVFDSSMPEIGSLSNVFQSGNHFPQITNKLVSKKHCQVQALESASLNGLCQCILVYPTSLCQLHCWLDTDG